MILLSMPNLSAMLYAEIAKCSGNIDNHNHSSNDNWRYEYSL